MAKKFIFPKLCPSCGSETIKEFNKITKKFDAVRRCRNDNFDCERISIEKIKHFVSKDAFNIDGLGKKIVESFWKLKLIRNPSDIFKLDYEKISKLDGWGKLSAANLKYSINLKKKISLDKFIYSLGIRHIGQENARLISKNLKHPDNFFNLSDKNHFADLLNIDGIGDTQINSLKNFFSNKNSIAVLKDLGKILEIIPEKHRSLSGILKDFTFMFTGKLEGISRAEAKSLIEKNSGKIISNVSKKLNFLVVGEKPTSRKVNEAKNLNIKVINQKDLVKMINSKDGT